MNLQNWTAVIPAYNAGANLLNVIQGVNAYISLDRIWVVNDGSTDNTAEIMSQSGVNLLTERSNCGKGKALRDGFHCVLAQNPEWIICIDGDGQHDPAAIPHFQKAAEEGIFDLIVGNRRHNLAGMPLNRRISNNLSSALVSMRTGLKLPDVQCGFRTIRADALRMMNLHAQSYEIEVEIILEAWKKGLTIGWVDIPTIYGDETSFLRKIPETIRFLKLMARSFYE